jgi:hypothetical protein
VEKIGGEIQYFKSVKRKRAKGIDWEKKRPAERI